jgi:hypothetical protein
MVYKRVLKLIATKQIENTVQKVNIGTRKMKNQYHYIRKKLYWSGNTSSFVGLVAVNMQIEKMKICKNNRGVSVSLAILSSQSYNAG